MGAEGGGGGSVPGSAEVGARPRGGFQATGMRSSLERHRRRDMRVARRDPHRPAHRQAHAEEGKRMKGRALSGQGIGLTHTSFLTRPAWEAVAVAAAAAAAAANNCLTLAVNYKLELRKRCSTLGGKITSAEILVPEKCRL